MSNEWKMRLARLLGVGGVLCGLIGVVAGLVEKQWRMGVTGWFTGGTLLAVLAILLAVDAYAEMRRQQLS